MELRTASQLQDAVQSHSYVVVDFAKRNNCVWCKRLEPHFKATARRFEDVLFAVIHLDEIEQGDFFDIIDQYHVLQTPTVIFFDSGDWIAVEGRTAVELTKEIEGLLNERR